MCGQNIVDRRVLAVVAKNGNELAGYFDRFPFAFAEVFNPANRVKLSHGAPSVSASLDRTPADCHDSSGSSKDSQ